MKHLLLILAASITFGLSAAAQFPIQVGMLPDNVLVYNDEESGPDGRLPFMKPMWFIYPDSPCSQEEADALLTELGLKGILKGYVAAALVINPVDGVAYDREKDFALYQELFHKIRVFVNLKVVGIGNGATFVNEAIGPVASEVADIFCFGGKAPKKVDGVSTVPAYLSGKEAAKAAKAYIARDKAVLVEDGKTLKVYRNPEEPLLQIIVNTEKNPSLKEAFADAWERLLSRNHRASNYKHTGYMGGELGQYGDYEPEPYLMWERLGTRRELCIQQLLPSRQVLTNYLWYEYIPAGMDEAAPGSVPLVILLHGHNNDPRTQAESSGFVQLGAEEGFLVAELEWQGKGNYNFMDDEGIELTIREIMRRHPQVDPARIYAEGMSAGGFAATALGIRKPYLFAAVGAHSGGLFYNEFRLGFPFQDHDGLMQEAKFLRGKATMPYFSIGGTADDGVPFMDPDKPNGLLLFNAWKAYQTYNGLEVHETPDLSKDPIFGISLDNRRRIETSKRHAMETGDLQDKDGHPILRIVAVEDYGHWNFVPGAREMWNFFKHWSRDPETHESIWHEQ